MQNDRAGRNGCDITPNVKNEAHIDHRSALSAWLADDDGGTERFPSPRLPSFSYTHSGDAAHKVFDRVALFGPCQTTDTDNFVMSDSIFSRMDGSANA